LIIKNLLKALLILCLATCCGFALVLFVAEKEKPFPVIPIPTENEQFLILQKKYEQNLEQSIINLLEPLAGRGKVRVSAKIELNLKNAQTKHRTETQNLPNEQLIANTSLYTDVSEKHIQNSIQKQHIGIVVDGNVSNDTQHIYQPRSQRELNAYFRLVQSAVGYDPQRGDTLEIQNIPFSFHQSTPQIQKKYAFLLALILAIMAFLLFLLGLSGCEKNAPTQQQKPTPFSAEKFNQILQYPDRAAAVFKNWIYLPASDKSSDWAPIQKVGIALLTADEDFVRQILIALDDEEVRQLSKTMATLGVIPPQESARILNELYEAMFIGSTVIGNPVRAQQILKKSTKQNTSFIQPDWQSVHQILWQELEDIPTIALAQKLDGIPAETAAYILYQLSAQKAAETIPHFAPQKTNQILIHLSHIGQVRSETNKKMAEEALACAQQILDNLHTPSGTEKTSEILAQLKNTTTEKDIIQNLAHKEPSLAKKLSAQLIRFDDLAKWQANDIRTLLKNTPRTTVLKALIDAPKSIVKQIQDNVPSQVWQALEKEIHEQKDKISSDAITQARNHLVEIARALLQQGKIEI